MTGHVKELSPEDPFSARLSRLMFEGRMSVGRLAQETGISERLIRKYRGGHSEPRDYFGDPTANALKIAEALSVPVEVLVPDPEDVAA